MYRDLVFVASKQQCPFANDLSMIPPLIIDVHCSVGVSEFAVQCNGDFSAPIHTAKCMSALALHLVACLS